MTAISHRLHAITGSEDDGWGVHYRAQAMKRAGEPVILLSVGDHDFTTDPAIVEACKASLDAGQHHYSPVTGTAELREAVAKRIEASTGVPTTPDQTIICPGGQAGLFACSMLALEPGDRGVIVEPYYATYAQTIKAAGGVPVCVPTAPENGFQPDAMAIAEAVNPNTRMILINSPQNPSGVVYTRDTLEGIADVCREDDVWLVSDEVYESQVYEGEHISPRALDGMGDRTLVIGSMSKSHAMTGWRVGWVVGPEPAIAALTDLFLTMTYGMASFIQEAALVGLNEGAAGETRIAALYRRRRDVALRALGASKKLRVHRPAAAMYLLIDVRAVCADGAAFANALLDAEKIGVMPGESFGASAAGHIRIALTVEDDALADACTRLARFADEWNPA
jgi:arginine:pyruvate transaminase